MIALVKYLSRAGGPGGRSAVGRSAHSFCAIGSPGHVSVALHLTVAQESDHVSSTSASSLGGRLRRHRDRRVHTDDAGLASPQHLAGAERLANRDEHGAARQHQPAADELGHASEPDDEPCCVGRLYEGEDALDGTDERRVAAPAQRGDAVVQCFAVFHRDGTNSASSSGTSTRMSS